MSIIYNNDFGSDTIGNPPPNTTSRWSTLNVTYSVQSIAGFTGGRGFRVATGLDNANRIRSFDAADGSLNARFRALFRLTDIGTGGGSQAAVILRGAGGEATDDGYELVLRPADTGAELFLFKFDNTGGDTSLATAAFTVAENDLVHYRFEAVDDSSGDCRLRAWVWQDGDPEPGTPNIDVLDSSPLSAGWVGVGTRQPNTIVDFDVVMIETVEGALLLAYYHY